MRIPHADRAVIEPAKLRDYRLSPTHPVGRFKAAFFLAHGYGAEDWQRLEWDLRRHVQADAASRQETRYGRKFEIRAQVVSPTGEVIDLVSVWIVPRGETAPRFVTAYPGG